jgi:hypothetical protein
MVWIALYLLNKENTFGTNMTTPAAQQSQLQPTEAGPAVSSTRKVAQPSETFSEKLARNPNWWAAIFVPVGIVVIAIVVVVLYFTVFQPSGDTPVFQRFYLSTGTFCKSVRYRYRLPDSTEFSNWSRPVGGEDVRGTQPVFSSPKNSAITVVWQRSVENTPAVTIPMTRIAAENLWVDDTWNPCTAPGLTFSGYFGEPIAGYQCPLEYRASYWPNGPWSSIVAISPPTGDVTFPGRPQFRVPEQQGLPTTLVFQRRALGTGNFVPVVMTTIPPTGTDLLFRDNTVGPCGSIVLPNVTVKAGENRFYINRADTTWFSVEVEPKSYPLNELFGIISARFANATTVRIETTGQDPRLVRPQYITNVKFEYLVRERVRVSIVGPTTYDGYFEQPGTEALFRVTTNSNTDGQFERNPPNMATQPNINTLLGFVPTAYAFPTSVIPSSVGQEAPQRPNFDM